MVSGAGVVSLAATSLVRKPMPPNPLLKRLNGHLGSFLKQHPFAPPVEPTLATEDDVLGARLSSFGFSGTIAHARFSPAMDDADDRWYGAAPAQPYVAVFRSRAPCFPQLDAVRRGQCHRRSTRDERSSRTSFTSRTCASRRVQASSYEPTAKRYTAQGTVHGTRYTAQGTRQEVPR